MAPRGDLAAGLHKVIAMAAGSGDPEALRVADALGLWLDGADSVRLEDALGVAGNWRSAMRRRRRDELYAGIARMNFPHLKGLPLARAIATSAYRYQTSAWRCDRGNGRRPAGPNGLLYDLLSLAEHFLLDIEALRKLPGIFRAGEYRNQDLRFGGQEGNDVERNDEVFERSR